MTELRAKIRVCDECPFKNPHHEACIHPKCGMPGRRMDDEDPAAPPKWCPLRKKPVTFSVVTPPRPKPKKRKPSGRDLPGLGVGSYASWDAAWTKAEKRAGMR